MADPSVLRLGFRTVRRLKESTLASTGWCGEQTSSSGRRSCWRRSATWFQRQLRSTTTIGSATCGTGRHHPRQMAYPCC